jgi:hypothetical protein
VWIVEAPGVSGKISKLASFGSVQFTSALATISGVTGAINSPSWQSLSLAIASHNMQYGDPHGRLATRGAQRLSRRRNPAWLSTTDNPTPGTIRRPRPSPWPRGRLSRPFHVACLCVNVLALGKIFGLVPGIWIERKSGVIEERMAAIYVGPLPISHFLWRRS